MTVSSRLSPAASTALRTGPLGEPGNPGRRRGRSRTEGPRRRAATRGSALVLLGALVAAGAGAGEGGVAGSGSLASVIATARDGVVPGADGWLHLERELRHLDREAWWPAPDTTGPEDGPTAVLLELRRELRERGIELIVAPVPSRSALAPVGLPVAPRDTYDRAFLRHLADRGLRVLDLHPVLEPLGTEAWCRTDTHWSPRGLEAAAAAIAGAIAEADAPAGSPPASPWTTEAATVEVRGDLLRMAGATAGDATERLEIRRVLGSAPTVERGAPVLLLGDSHTLVFHAGGDLHAESAGLPDHLARLLGEPVDLVGVRGSGSTAARVNLYRRGAGALDATRVVVWVFALRETTEELPWRRVPLPPPG